MIKKWKQRRAAEKLRKQQIADSEFLTALKNTAASIAGIRLNNPVDPALGPSEVAYALNKLVVYETGGYNPNICLAHQLLFVEPETGEELFVKDIPKDMSTGTFTFTVSNKKGTAVWRHTIKTEEV